MSQITDINLFRGIINIDTSRQEIEEELIDYCLTIEADALRKILGDTLYTEYLQDEGEGDKWDELINGIDGTFEYNNKTVTYTGLVDKICYLIYLKYVQDQVSSNTTFGEVVPDPSNGTQQYNTPKMVRAYNKWVDAFNSAVDFINYKNTETPDTYYGFNTSYLDYANTWFL
jgi:hypothetical protein